MRKQDLIPNIFTSSRNSFLL